MSHYAVEIDLDLPNTSHVQVIDLVGQDKRVLDVGCWTGDVGRVLAGRGCTVTGVEIDPEAAAVAEKVLDKVVVADIDGAPLSTLVEPGFDVIVFADVLEHLADPQAVLEDARSLLAPGGQVVISIPNVTHGSLRLALLQGRWRTTDTGLLDRTHIKFYSRTGLVTLLNDAGYAVEDLRGTTADPLNVEVEVDPTVFPDEVVEWVRNQPDALVYQFQLAARPLAEGEAAPPAPELVPAGDPDAVRIRDEQTVRFEQAHRSRLMMRDHVLGLQATANTAQAEVGTLRKKLRDTRAVSKRRHERIERLLAKVERLEARIADLEHQVRFATRHPAKNITKKAVRRLKDL